MSFGPVLDAALEAQAAYRAAGLRGCAIGGVALQRWGEPRFTADADLTVLAETGEEARVVDALLEHVPARIDDAREFALRSRVLLARSGDGVGLDIVLAGLPFERRVIDRATPWHLGEGVELDTCSAEDLLVMKAFAGRDRDWADITGVLERQNDKLDLELIRKELRPLLQAKEAPELGDELERRIARVLTRDRS